MSMGTKETVERLYYLFSLEERVPLDHLLRKVCKAVDFSFVRRKTRRFYSHVGRPSIDPVVIFKMALVGFLYNIPSERRLAEELKLNLAYLWFIGYNIEESVPNHSVLSKARKRYGPTVYLSFFKEIVRQCERAGLVEGNRIYVDSTLVEADAANDSLRSRELLAQLPDPAEYVDRLWQDNPDQPESAGLDASSGVAEPNHAIPVPLPTLATGTANSTAGLQEPRGDEAQPEVQEATSEGAPQAGPELVTVQDSEPTLASGSQGAACGEVRPPTIPLHAAGPGDEPNQIVGKCNELLASRVDPAAAVVCRDQFPFGLYHKIHAVVDGGRARIVTAVNVTDGAFPDGKMLVPLIREHEDNVGHSVEEVGADTGYGTVANYRILEELGVKASIPMLGRPGKERAVPTASFEYNLKTDSVTCPNGQRLYRDGTSEGRWGERRIVYRSHPKLCAECSLKAECLQGAKQRVVLRPCDGGLRDRVMAYLRTPHAQWTIRQRKAWIETIFGDGKVRRGQRRARGRGSNPMLIQALMIGMVQNIRKLAVSNGKRPVTGVGALEKDAPHPLISAFLSFLLRLGLALGELYHNRMPFPATT